MNTAVQLTRYQPEGIGANDLEFNSEVMKALELTTASIFPSGSQLFQEGEPVREVFLIESGIIKLLRNNEAGNEFILGLRCSGWPLGAAAAFLGKPYPATAVVISRSQVYRTPAKRFCQLVESDARISYLLHSLHSREIYQQYVDTSGLAIRSARQRLEQLLYQFALNVEGVETPDGLRLQMPLKRSEVAQCLAISAQHLSGLLRELETDGLLRRKNGWLFVTDSKKLWREGNEFRAVSHGW